MGHYSVLQTLSAAINSVWALFHTSVLPTWQPGLFSPASTACVNKDTQNLSSAVFVCISVCGSGTDCDCVYIHLSCHSSWKLNWSYPSLFWNGVIFIQHAYSTLLMCLLRDTSGLVWIYGSWTGPGLLQCQNGFVSSVFRTFGRWSNLTMLSCGRLELKAGLFLGAWNLASIRLLYHYK